MATIVLTSNQRGSSVLEQNHEAVFALYSWGKSKRVGQRAIIDILLDILKYARSCSKISGIRHAIKIGDYARVKEFMSILCHFGLLTEISITQKCKSKNKNTDRKEKRTIKRYYLTPKGHNLIHIYDKMIEQLVAF